jgi:uncharacterized protein YndB with AHSA1/START domain
MTTNPNLSLSRSIEVAAALELVWQALTDELIIETWMGEDCQLDLRTGGAVTFFGGSVSGRITHVREGRILEYTWRQHYWNKEWKDSVVLWELRPGQAPGSTRLKLTHSHLPNIAERNNHQQGWWTYWLEPMCRWLEDRDHPLGPNPVELVA